ncbi:MAG: hypothetical protein OXF73_14245 [Gammaproteobacteria bacterium]|nr:hypothetical protein [Gammaproteobacteria bacterium]MCY4228150.1 hypothetical protein [Gammaproteobacteria bacterium]
MNKENIIDKSIIAVCTFFVTVGILQLAIHKQAALAWLVIAVMSYFITEFVCGILEDRLPWRKNNDDDHE